LVPINALLDPGIDLAHGAEYCNVMEKTVEHRKSVLDSYDIKEGEVLIIVNAYGINTTTIEVLVSLSVIPTLLVFIFFRHNIISGPPNRYLSI